MPDVRCTVNNCKYWGSNNECQATEITVQNDNASGYSSDGPESELSGTPATTEEATCCRTFIRQ